MREFCATSIVPLVVGSLTCDRSTPGRTIASARPLPAAVPLRHSRCWKPLSFPPNPLSVRTSQSPASATSDSCLLKSSKSTMSYQMLWHQAFSATRSFRTPKSALLRSLYLSLASWPKGERPDTYRFERSRIELVGYLLVPLLLVCSPCHQSCVAVRQHRQTLPLPGIDWGTLYAVPQSIDMGNSTKGCKWC